MHFVNSISYQPSWLHWFRYPCTYMLFDGSGYHESQTLTILNNYYYCRTLFFRKMWHILLVVLVLIGISWWRCTTTIQTCRKVCELVTMTLRWLFFAGINDNLFLWIGPKMQNSLTNAKALCIRICWPLTTLHTNHKINVSTCKVRFKPKSHKNVPATNCHPKVVFMLSDIQGPTTNDLQWWKSHILCMVTKV